MSETDNKPDNEAPEKETAETAQAETGTDAQAESGPDAADGPASPEERVAELEAELAVVRDRQMRLAAEMENTRKRAEKEVRDTREYAVSRFAGDMLAVADNLSRALDAARKGEESDSVEAIKSMIEGVSMTERALLSTLERHGVTKVDPQPGDPFDPNVHQAAAQIPSDQPQGRIAAVMQTGYVIGQRTLRAAMVAVSAGGQGGQTGGDTPEGGGSVDIQA